MLMETIQITKEWLKENSKHFSSIYIPEYGKGFVRWTDNTHEQLDFMIEDDAGGITYHIVTFDYIIEHKEDIAIYIETEYTFC